MKGATTMPSVDNNMSDYVIVDTERFSDNNCLLRALAISLVVHSQHAVNDTDITPLAIQWYGHFDRLFEKLKKQPKDFNQLLGLATDSSDTEVTTVDPNIVKDFAALAKLAPKEYQQRIAVALREIASDLLQNNQAKKSDLFAHLSADFEGYCTNSGDLTDTFQGMDFVKQKFTELTGTALDLNQQKEKLKLWWQDKGYNQYVDAIRDHSTYLGEETIGVIAKEFGIDFRYKQAHQFGLREATNNNSPIVIHGWYNGTNHWCAYLPIELANQALNKEPHATEITNDIYSDNPSTNVNINDYSCDEILLKWANGIYSNSYNSNTIINDLRLIIEKYGFSKKLFKNFKTFYNEKRAECCKDESIAYALARMDEYREQEAEIFSSNYINQLKHGASEYQALGWCFYSKVKQQLELSDDKHRALFAQMFAKAVEKAGCFAKVKLEKVTEKFQEKISQEGSKNQKLLSWMQGAERFKTIACEIEAFKDIKDSMKFHLNDQGVVSTTLPDGRVFERQMGTDTVRISVQQKESYNLEESFRCIAQLFLAEYKHQKSTEGTDTAAPSIVIKSMTPPKAREQLEKAFKEAGFEKVHFEMQQPTPSTLRPAIGA